MNKENVKNRIILTRVKNDKKKMYTVYDLSINV